MAQSAASGRAAEISRLRACIGHFAHRTLDDVILDVIVEQRG